MKKVITLLLSALLIACLFTSCDDSTDEKLFMGKSTAGYPKIKAVPVRVVGGKLLAGDTEVEINVAGARATLTEEQLNLLAEKINTMQAGKSLASFDKTRLVESTRINKPEGFNAIINALQKKTSDGTAKSNIGAKSSREINLLVSVELCSVDIESTESMSLEYVEFEVKPIATTTVKDSTGSDVSVTAEIKSTLTEPIAFRLPLESSITDKDMAVYHEGVYIGNQKIQTEDNEKFVELESKDFSKYGYRILNEKNAGAKISDTFYWKFEEALSEVKNNETILLLKDTGTDTTTIEKEITFTVDKNGKSLNATLSAATGFRKTETESGTTIKYEFASVTPVKYLEWDDSQKKRIEKSTSDYEIVTTDTATLDAGKFYVVSDSISITSLAVNGTSASPTTLIVCDGSALTVTGGIKVSSGNSFIVCGQENDSGELVVTSGNNNAGIGGQSGNGGTIAINGGIVTATGGEQGAGIGGGRTGSSGEVTIYGGIITATGGKNGAGIGGGYQGTGGTSGTITIYGGTITAVGSTGSGNGSGAGIGGGYGTGGSGGCGGTITINNGTVTATGYNDGAGIGSTCSSSGAGTLTINGGTVTATGGANGAGIGGGKGSAGGTITINGGTVIAMTCPGVTYATGAGIGGGYGEVGGTITINGGTVEASSYDGAGIGSGAAINPAAGTVYINGGMITASSILGQGIGKGNNSVMGLVTVVFDGSKTFTVKAGDDSASAVDVDPSNYAGSHMQKYAEVKEVTT